MAVNKISIIKTDYGWTVIADGRIAEDLSTDEVFGQVAHLLILGKPQFRSYSISERRDVWNQPKGLLQ